MTPAEAAEAVAHEYELTGTVEADRIAYAFRRFAALLLRGTA